MSAIQCQAPLEVCLVCKALFSSYSSQCGAIYLRPTMCLGLSEVLQLQTLGCVLRKRCSQQGPACCAGLEEEFVFVGRLDNLGMSYLSLQALIDSTSRPEALADETSVRAVALFDHEEVGSASAQGELLAATCFLRTVCSCQRPSPGWL